MDFVAFLDFPGLGPRAIGSDHEWTQSEGSSNDDGVVRAEVWTVDANSLHSADQVMAGDATERLFVRGPRDSTANRRRGGTSLFSERTRRRWALGLEGTAPAAHEGDVGGDFPQAPAVGAQRRGRRQGLRSHKAEKAREKAYWAKVVAGGWGNEL
jgi:hypothetical protein